MSQPSDSGPIVAALSLTDADDVVVRAAVDLARKLATDVQPVHALDAISGRTLEATDAETREAEAAIQLLFAGDVAAGASVLAPVVEVGEPSALVIRVAEEARARMVVTGGGEKPTVRRFLIGSVAERIVRGSPRPVWVARGLAPADVRRVLCAVDLSSLSLATYREAARLARAFEAPLRIVTVVSRESGIVIGTSALARFVDRIDAARAEEMRLLLAADADPDVPIDVDVRAGKPAAEILEAAHDADVIVLGCGSHAKLGRWALGGTAEKVLRAAWSSVLTVRDER